MSVLFPFLCAWVSKGMLMSSWHKEPVGRALAPQLVWSQPWGPKVPEGASLHLFLQDEGEK